MKTWLSILIFLSILLTPAPACSSPPHKHIITNPEVRFVIWGNQPDTAALLENDWHSLFANGVLDRLAEYGVRGGSLGPTTAAMPDLQPAVYDDAWVTKTFLSEIVPAPGILWVIVLPTGSSTTGIQASHSSGYHWWGVVPYAVVTDNEILISHEIYEMATDPDGLGYRWGVDKEVGDYCEGQIEEIAGVQVQKVWSVEKGECL